MKVIKKNGVIVPYDEQKIIDACDKSARRVLQNLTEEDYSAICNKVADIISEEDFYVEGQINDIIETNKYQQKQLDEHLASIN